MKNYLNLLPVQYRVNEVARRRLLQWSLVWAACATAMISVWGLKHIRYQAAHKAMEAAERSYAPLERLIRESETMRTELQELHAKGTVLGKLVEERPPLTLIGLVSRSARQCNGRLVVRSLLLQRREEPADADALEVKKRAKEPSGETAEKAGPWAVVTLKGDALDNVAVAAFVVGLRDSELFRRVELKSTVGKHPANDEIRSYLVECDI